MGISRMGMYVTGYIGTSSKRQVNEEKITQYS